MIFHPTPCFSLYLKLRICILFIISCYGYGCTSLLLRVSYKMLLTRREFSENLGLSIKLAPEGMTGVKFLCHVLRSLEILEKRFC